MDHLAPIAVFGFNRPEHLKRVLASLRSNPESADSDLTVFLDGPRGAGDEEAIASVRQVAEGTSGFRSVTVRARTDNAGCDPAIAAGISEMCSNHDRVVVLEDDMLVSRVFLAFMNGALDLYADDSRVAAVTGYTFPHRAGLPDTFFLRGAHTGGFATWARAWAAFEPDPVKLLEELRDQDLIREFDHEVFFYSKMLESNGDEPCPWDVQWYASTFLKDWYSLFPGTSLVQNIGFDGSGTHYGETDSWDVPVSEMVPGLERISVEEDPSGEREFRWFLKRQLSPIRRFLLALPGGYPHFLPKRTRRAPFGLWGNAPRRRSRR